MTQEELAERLTSLEKEPGDLQEFIENSWGDNNVDDTANGAYTIGFDDGFNEGLQAVRRLLFLEPLNEN